MLLFKLLHNFWYKPFYSISFFSSYYTQPDSLVIYLFYVDNGRKEFKKQCI